LFANCAKAKAAAAIHTELEHRVNEAPPMLDEPVPLSINGAPVKGPATAKITLVEFSDFQCPYCAAAIHPLDDLLAKHPQEYGSFLSIPAGHPFRCGMAAEAALAAHAK